MALIDLDNLYFASNMIYCTSQRAWSVKERGTNKIALGGVKVFNGTKWSSYRAMKSEIKDYVIPNITAWLANPVFVESSAGPIDLKIVWDVVDGVGIDIWRVGVDGEIEGDTARAIVRRTAIMDKDQRLVDHLTAVRKVLVAKFGA